MKTASPKRRNAVRRDSVIVSVVAAPRRRGYYISHQNTLGSAKAVIVFETILNERLDLSVFILVVPTQNFNVAIQLLDLNALLVDSVVRCLQLRL